MKNIIKIITILISFYLVMLSGVLSVAAAETLYNQPPLTDGVTYKSSKYQPDGWNGDEFVWDEFSLTVNSEIQQLHWRGAYKPVYGLPNGGPVTDFRIEIYSTGPGGYQPDISSVLTPNPLVRFNTGGNAGETSAGLFNGVQMFDYNAFLPTSFQALANTKYWVKIEAWQMNMSDWELSAGSGGNGSHIRKTGSYFDYRGIPGDTSFSLTGVSQNPPAVAEFNSSTTLVVLFVSATSYFLFRKRFEKQSYK